MVIFIHMILWIRWKRDCTSCVCCEVEIAKIYVIRSDILDKGIIIGSECLKNHKWPKGSSKFICQNVF